MQAAGGALLWKRVRPNRGARRGERRPTVIGVAISEKFADQVGPARKGAAAHAGGKAEVTCYADI